MTTSAPAASTSDTTHIEPDDFVRSRILRHVCGFVIARRTIAVGKLPGFTVRLANGREDFIGDDDIELVAMSEEHLLRVMGVKDEQANDEPTPATTNTTDDTRAFETIEAARAAIRIAHEQVKQNAAASYALTVAEPDASKRDWNALDSLHAQTVELRLRIEAIDVWMADHDMPERFSVEYGAGYNPRLDELFGTGWRSTRSHLDAMLYGSPVTRSYLLADGRAVKIVEHGYHDTLTVYANETSWRRAKQQAERMEPDPETGRRAALYDTAPVPAVVSDLAYSDGAGGTLPSATSFADVYAGTEFPATATLPEYEPEPSPAEQRLILAHEYDMEARIAPEPPLNPDDLPEPDDRDWSAYYETEADTTDISNLLCEGAGVLVGEDMSDDSIEDYEAAQISEAKWLIQERERAWDNREKRVLYSIIGQLALIRSYYVSQAENELRAEKLLAGRGDASEAVA